MGLSLIKDGDSEQKALQVLPANVYYPESGQVFLSQTEESHFWFTSRRNVILQCLSRAKFSENEKVYGLDIGCGTGFTANWLSDRGFRVMGVDAFSPIFKNKTKANRFFRFDIFSIEPEPEFDFVLLLDVIEHIEDDARFVAHALKFVKPGGVAIISVPAFEWLWSPIDETALHFRRYSKSRLRTMLSPMTRSMRMEQEFYYYGTTLPLYLLSRMTQKFFKKNVSDEAKPSATLNSFCKSILKLEQAFLPVGLPFGSSLFVQIRKL